ncbi:hypothetical protein [Microbacterium elymi]|uniref:Uncharacterized protein n=1 Tax=Microbacterium elymi TaxID=2909587 RepID=A0ABY5NJN3_9MICO|nr:hypothetical protein [Microbacterium elymi]UUT35372.1 hypothetical protein L2X98_18290 [Microbacterium elymi]
MRSRSPVPGIFIGIGGVVLAAWIAFGRALFGIAGELTLVYALTLGVIYAVLQVFLGRSVARTAQAGTPAARGDTGHAVRLVGLARCSWA